MRNSSEELAMRARAYYKGHSWGWYLAGRYLNGTRADRREVRRYVNRARAVFGNPFLDGLRDSIADRCEERAAAIEAGTAPRSIAPRKARWLAWHC